MNSYVIITPAYNEAQYIGMTIESVIAQTIRPLLWVIVDDGSTDETAEIIKSYAQKHEWIRYVHRRKTPGQTYFGSNVHAIMEGYEQVKDLSFGYVAILDTDISLPPTYYETVLGRFNQDPKLGIASGVYENLVRGKLHKVLNDRRSTPKAIMVFRREVFEQIDGFLPLAFGGEDTAACIMARMEGWRTWSFPDVKVVHLRPTGTGNGGNMLSVRFNQGVCEYNLAMHPLFFLLKACRRTLLERPYIIGGLMRLAGYLWAVLRRDKIVLHPDVVHFIRKEQIGRTLRCNRIPEKEKVVVQSQNDATRQRK